jgi:hypothetical protein
MRNHRPFGSKRQIRVRIKPARGCSLAARGTDLPERTLSRLTDHWEAIIMFGNLRNKMPSMDEAAEVARDSVVRAANHTAASAREMDEQLEDWAKDGYDAVRARPIVWGAASLGIGALMGGLYALWQREAKRGTRPSRKSMAARSRTKQAVRMDGETNGRTNGIARKRKKTRKPRAIRTIRESAVSE